MTSLSLIVLNQLTHLYRDHRQPGADLEFQKADLTVYHDFWQLGTHEQS